MGKYNPLYKCIWSDNKFEEYSPEKKLIWIFLLTNQFVERSGIYKISVRQISFFTGIINESINESINELIDENKVKYNSSNATIFVKNLFKYQRGTIKNPNVMICDLKRNQELVPCEFWDDFFDLYKEDKLVKLFVEKRINDSLMNHQSSISNSNSISNSKSKKKSSVKKTKLQKNLEAINKHLGENG